MSLTRPWIAKCDCCGTERRCDVRGAIDANRQLKAEGWVRARYLDRYTYYYCPTCWPLMQTTRGLEEKALN